MRAQVKATRLSGLLCISGLIACLIGSSFAQAPPQQLDEQLANETEPDKKGSSSSPDQKKEMMGMKEKETKADMLRVMGPYTPREFYPSLMQLPDLSPEKRAEIKRLASLRMEDGLQILTESRAALTAAS